MDSKREIFGKNSGNIRENNGKYSGKKREIFGKKTGNIREKNGKNSGKWERDGIGMGIDFVGMGSGWGLKLENGKGKKRD